MDTIRDYYYEQDYRDGCNVEDETSLFCDFDTEQFISDVMVEIIGFKPVNSYQIITELLNRHLPPGASLVQLRRKTLEVSAKGVWIHGDFYINEQEEGLDFYIECAIDAVCTDHNIQDWIRKMAIIP